MEGGVNLECCARGGKGNFLERYPLLLALTPPARNWPSFRGPGARLMDR